MNHLSAYIDTATHLPAESKGYDIIVVTTGSPFEASFWQERLELSRGIVSNRNCRILAVHEDWNSEEGAGNLLGTLYAWQKASGMHQEMTGTSLDEALDEGKSVAMYHLAGLGTRLAPLPAAEYNSKSAVKLPALLTLTPSHTALMTVLEAVILQTGPFARSRKGRLSVWWGDQIFIPSSWESPGLHHVEILAKKTEVTRELENYGLLIFCEGGDCLQREKMPLEKIIRALKGDDGQEKDAGISLGSFSVSGEFLKTLLEEFSCELSDRKGRLNTDGDLWQPLTSTSQEYKEAGRSELTWQRITALWEKFLKTTTSPLRKFGYLDIGESYWWDFGQLRLYYRNLMKMLDQSAEGDAMRRFFQAPGPSANAPGTGALISDSLIIGSSVISGNVRRSLVINSQLQDADIEESLVIESVVLGTLKSRQGIIYHCLEEGSLHLEDREVSAGVLLPPDNLARLRLILDRKEEEPWRKPLLDNLMSFREIWKILKNMDRNEHEKLFQARREKLIPGARQSIDA